MIRIRFGAFAVLVSGAAALALLGSGVAGSANDAADGGIVEPVVRDKPAADPQGKGGALPTLTLAKLKRAPTEGNVTNVFTGKSWTPPAPPPPPPVIAAPPPPPPAPTAPALPFTYVGRLEVQDEKPLFYLGRGEQVFTVTEGEVIEDTYRIDAIEDTELVIVYLPLNVRQGLRVGGER